LKFFIRKNFKGNAPIVKYRGVDLLIYYLDLFHEVEVRVLDYIRNTNKLVRILKDIDSSVIRIHWSALVATNGKLVAELWIETKNGLLRALVSDHDKTSLLRLWSKIKEALREDYEHFIGISLRVQKSDRVNQIIEFIRYESRMLEEEVELLSRIQASGLPKVRRLIHLQPWEGLLILEFDDEVSVYKASRVALRQAIPEIEKRYKLEAEVLSRSFLEA